MWRFSAGGEKSIANIEANFRKILTFSGNCSKNFEFPGKNCSFTAISGQIILFLFKSHHFRKYFLNMLRYNNISRPVHEPPATPLRTPPTTPVQNLGGRDPQPARIDAPDYHYPFFLLGEKTPLPTSTGLPSGSA